jgi:hypothetical protein
MALAVACSSTTEGAVIAGQEPGSTIADLSASDATPKVVVTRIMAMVSGILVEEDGCLRIYEDWETDRPSRAIVWQKHLFDISRVEDEIRIVDREVGNQENPTVWKLGEHIRTSGGESGGPGDYGYTEFQERCEGPFTFVSGAETNSEPVLAP